MSDIVQQLPYRAQSLMHHPCHELPVLCTICGHLHAVFVSTCPHLLLTQTPCVLWTDLGRITTSHDPYMVNVKEIESSGYSANLPHKRRVPVIQSFSHHATCSTFSHCTELSLPSYCNSRSSSGASSRGLGFCIPIIHPTTPAGSHPPIMS